MLDIVGALLLLVPALPIIALAGLLVRLTSPGPAFYMQTRIGRGGGTYTIYKIRTMVHNCEHETGPSWAAALEAHITPVGRVLRRSHLDELPQLLNVLRGDMSLVGPRPERPEFVPLLAKAIPGYTERHAVRPGMTGLAQVHLPPDTDVDSVQRKLKYDLYYLHHCSFRLDLRILAATAYYLVGVPFWRVPEWLQAPGPALIEQPAAPGPSGFALPPSARAETQVLPETCAMSEAR